MSGSFAPPSTGSSSLSPCNVAAHRVTSNQTSIAFGNYTQIIFNNETIDTDNAYNNSNGNFTVPTGKSGNYLISAGVSLNIGCTNIFLTVFLGNGEFRRISLSSSASDSALAAFGSCVVPLNAGDVISIRVFQLNTSSAAREAITGNSQTYLDIMRLS